MKVGRRFRGYTADIPLPCAKGAQGMRPLIVDTQLSSHGLIWKRACVGGHEANVQVVY